MHIIDIIVFLLFTGGVVAFGCSFFKKKGTSEEFTSAGRSLPGWVVGMSIFATYVSSISYLGYPGKAFSGDWNAFVFSLSIPIASYFAARYFVPFYRSQDSISAYSFLENRFGPWARIYASSCYLLTQIGTYRVYPVFVGVAHECIVGMAYPDHYCCNQCGYCALFHVGWHEGCHLDRGHTGNYSDRRCVGMYVYFAF